MYDWIQLILGIGYLLFCYRDSLLSQLITIDSIYSTLDYFLTFFCSSVKSSQSNPIWDRYSLYGILFFLAHLLNLLSFHKFSFELSFTIPLLSIPFIQKFVWDFSLMKKVRHRIYREVQYYCRQFLCFLFASVLNLICEVALGNNPAISTWEMSTVMEGHDVADLMPFIRVFVFTNILAKIKDRRPSLLPMIKTFYNAGQIMDDPIVCRYEDPFPHLKNKTDKIRAILSKRRWEQFHNPEMLMALIELYEEKNPSMTWDLIKPGLSYLGKVTGRFGSLYTLGSLFSQPFLTIGVSLWLFGWKICKKRLFSRSQMCFGVGRRLLSFLIMLSNSSWLNLVTALLISEYGEFLEGAPLDLFVARLGKKKNIYRRSFLSTRSNLCAVFVSVIYLLGLRFLDPPAFFWYVSIGLGLIFSQDWIIFGLLAVCGAFSYYDWQHLLQISAVAYLGRYLARCFTLPDEVIENPLIESYINTPPSQSDDDSRRISKESLNNRHIVSTDPSSKHQIGSTDPSSKKGQSKSKRRSRSFTEISPRQTLSNVQSQLRTDVDPSEELLRLQSRRDIEDDTSRRRLYDDYISYTNYLEQSVYFP